MTRGLAIETSGRSGSVALVDDGDVVALSLVPTGLKHAAALVPTIDRLCLEHAWAASSLRVIYVAIGPGSFTGLRIGVTLAKTLAWATGARVVAVASHQVLAENAPAEATELVTLLDAKRGQIFTARFRRSASGAWEESEQAHVDTLSAMLARAGRPVWLIGDGIPFHESAVPSGESVTIIGSDAWRCRAEIVARLGARAAARGEFADVATLEPLYIRLAEAEEKRLAAAGL